MKMLKIALFSSDIHVSRQGSSCSLSAATSCSAITPRTPTILRAATLLAAAASLIAAPISACTIYFTNNTPDTEALIILTDNSAAIPVHVNKTKMFGDGTKHAEFTVWQKSKGADRFKRVAFLKQHGCNRGKRIDITMSDVLRGQVNTGLFNITPY